MTKSKSHNQNVKWLDTKNARLFAKGKIKIDQRYMVNNGKEILFTYSSLNGRWAANTDVEYSDEEAALDEQDFNSDNYDEMTEYQQLIANENIDNTYKQKVIKQSLDRRTSKVTKENRFTTNFKRTGFKTALKDFEHIFSKQTLNDLKETKYLSKKLIIKAMNSAKRKDLSNEFNKFLLKISKNNKK